MDLEKICVSCMEDDSGNPICPKCGAPFHLPVNNLLLLPPRTILREQYLIGRALGHGGFGITYLAWDIGLQIRLAVKEYMPAGVVGRTDRTKVMPVSEATRQEYEWGLERFLEEARVLKKSNHPNIVTVDTVFRDNGTAYLVMEYLEGMNFAEFLGRRGGSISFADALRVMAPVMDALIAVHAVDIVHRDVSPDNIFIPRMGKVKLIDFGAARNALSQKSRNLSAILKAGYAPEEQYRASGRQGPWTDVYATAATLYRAITGKVPAPSLDRQAEDTLDRPSKLGIAIPPSAESALMKAMAVRGDDRYQSMDEFKRALTGGVSAPRAGPIPLPGEGTAVPIATPAPNLEAAIQKYENKAPKVEPPVRGVAPAKVATAAAARKAPKWLLPAMVAAVLVLAAGGGVVWFLKHRSPAPAPVAAGLTEWPAQPSGIPQTDVERQRQLEAQGQDQNAATPAAPPPAAEIAQSKPAPFPGAARSQTGHPPVAKQPEPAAAVTAPPPVAPPPVERKAIPVASYADMLKQATGMIGSKQYSEAQTLLNKAIETNPAGWQAYNAVAKIELYFLHQPGQAFGHYRAALSKGGVATLRVSQDHAEGWLNISKGNAGFQADDGSHSFDTAAVKEAKRNKGGLIKTGKGHHAFHIRVATGQNYNFEPGSQDPGEEVDFILSTIGS